MKVTKKLKEVLFTGLAGSGNEKEPAYMMSAKGTSAPQGLYNESEIGNLYERVFEANVGNEMPEKIVNPYSHGKEYYRSNIDLSIDEYNGLFYFIKHKYEEDTRVSYVCTSDEQGNNIKIVSEIPDDYFYGSIHVNCTGIYVYYTLDNDRLFVLHLGFDGTKLAERKEEYEGGYEDGYHVSNIYIYGNDLFYSYKHDTDEEKECCIKCMHIDTGRIEKIYDRASNIYSLYAMNEDIIFYADYENDECEQSGAGGWMIMNRFTDEVECISNPYCSPENVIDHPSYYDSESSDYNEKWNFDRKIVFFDLNRNIFWIERTERKASASGFVDWEEVKYWEPRNLRGNRDQFASGMPVWRINNYSVFGGREYFDGTVHYWAESYYIFKSSSKYGQIYDWSGHTGHGKCDYFKVVGGYLFLDVDTEGAKQYPLTVGVSSPIRESWFGKALPESVINEFLVHEFDTLFDCGKQEQLAAEPNNELKIGELVRTVLKPLLISRASAEEIRLMQEAEYSKKTFGITYPLLVKSSQPFDRRRYYSEVLIIREEQYHLCSQWFETPANNDRPYVEKWIREHQ